MKLMIKSMFKNRFVVFFGYLSLFLIFNYFFTGALFPTTATQDLWFYSGLFMILFSILFIEPYYTSPKNVITNAIPLLLVLLSTEVDFPNKGVWWAAIGFAIILLVLSMIPLFLEDSNKSANHLRNRSAVFLKNFVVILGKGKLVYSGVFLLFLYLNITSKDVVDFVQIFDSYFVFLIISWGILLSLDPKELTNTFGTNKKKRIERDAIGDIIGVQSRKIFLARLYDDRTSVRRFDLVKFRYSMQDSNDYQISGIVFDTYLLNQERWVKILQLGRIDVSAQQMNNNTVYLVQDKEEKEQLEKELKVNSFVGVVSQDTNIGRLRFEYSKQKNNLQEGDLLELDFEGRRLFYQVVNGQTKVKNLEARNEVDYIEGVTIQLGEWDPQSLSFQKFGWVPPVNTPLFVADTSTLEIPSYSYPDYTLGLVPGTQIPSVINLHDAVSHHLALLGITGSGKSFLARRIIDKLKTDTQIICVDFTGEWRKQLGEGGIEEVTKENVDQFLKSTDQKVGIFELPSISNTVQVVEATAEMLGKIFEIAKSAYDAGEPKKICLVLEEAHTIVPEGNFLGVNNWESKAVVNKMGQIALQGRKYGVGLMILAQRTANVSKTVLTQCNTVICFQAFDETGFNFLGNYIGGDLVKSLPNLKKFHAIVTGKALKTNLPMIVDLEQGSPAEESDE